MLSGGHLRVAVKLTSSIFVKKLNAANPKSSKIQFQFQFELSLVQLTPSLFCFFETPQIFCFKLLAIPLSPPNAKISIKRERVRGTELQVKNKCHG